MVAARHFRSPWHTGRDASAAAALPRRTPRRVRAIIAGANDMRAHQPGSTPIDIPETVPNPAHTPAPAPAPERAPTKVPDKVPEKVIIRGIFLGSGPRHGPRLSACLIKELCIPVLSENFIRRGFAS